MRSIARCKRSVSMKITLAGKRKDERRPKPCTLDLFFLSIFHFSLKKEHLTVLDRRTVEFSTLILSIITLSVVDCEMINMENDSLCIPKNQSRSVEGLDVVYIWSVSL